MRQISCSKCGNQVSIQLAICADCAASPVAPEAMMNEFKAGDKERFELGIQMLKGYYDALEARLFGSITLFVVILGWLISSGPAREMLRNHWWVRMLSLVALTSVLVMYGWNVRHWLRRWRGIRDDVANIGYMEPKFYTRYERVPRGSWLLYFVPIFLLYMFSITVLLALDILI